MVIKNIFLSLLFIPVLLFGDPIQNETGPSKAKSQRKSLPWFVGPFFAEGANNLSKGTSATYFTYYYLKNYASYDNNWHSIKSTSVYASTYEGSVQFGITNWLDFGIDSSITRSTYLQYDSTHWKDTSVKLGFQIRKTSSNDAIPSIRFTVSESFPTGKYQNLNVDKNYIDATGIGAYSTTLGLDIGKTYKVFKNHYLLLVVNFHYEIPANVTVTSPNIYTGLANASGVVKPGKTICTYFSFDFSLTKHLAFSTDFFYMYVTKTRFSGTQEVFAPIGSIEPAAHAEAMAIPPPRLVISQAGMRAAIFTIAPALEWNFTKDLGIAVTYWFSVTGKNLSTFNCIGALISYTF